MFRLKNRAIEASSSQNTTHHMLQKIFRRTVEMGLHTLVTTAPG